MKIGIWVIYLLGAIAFLIATIFDYVTDRPDTASYHLWIMIALAVVALYYFLKSRKEK